MVEFRRLIEAGLHFGHQTSRWCPKMAPYIWGHKNGVHLINVMHISANLEKAGKFLETVAANGEVILFVGTKKSAKTAIAAHGTALKMPYVAHRWIGGTLTNYYQVKKAVTNLLHLEDVASKNEDAKYTKKEMVRFQKEADRLARKVGGLKELKMPVGAVVIIDVKREQTALLEAIAANVPVVALVDTNADPSGVNYVIPGNDDSAKSVQFVLDYLAQAVEKGLSNPVKKEKTVELSEEDQAVAKKATGRKPAGKKGITPKAPAISEELQAIIAGDVDADDL